MTVGSYAQSNIEDAYFLNTAGSHFVKAAQGAVGAFEVYADDVVSSNATQLQIVLDENAEDAPASMRGDVNMDGRLTIADVTDLIDYLLTNDATGIDLTAANCDLEGDVTIADVAALIDYLLIQEW
jgi:hypothetical protein